MKFLEIINCFINGASHEYYKEYSNIMVDEDLGMAFDEAEMFAHAFPNCSSAQAHEAGHHYIQNGGNSYAPLPVSAGTQTDKAEKLPGLLDHYKEGLAQRAQMIPRPVGDTPEIREQQRGWDMQHSILQGNGSPDVQMPMTAEEAGKVVDSFINATDDYCTMVSFQQGQNPTGDHVFFAKVCQNEDGGFGIDILDSYHQGISLSLMKDGSYTVCNTGG